MGQPGFSWATRLYQILRVHHDGSHCSHKRSLFVLHRDGNQHACSPWQICPPRPAATYSRLNHFSNLSFGHRREVTGCFLANPYKARKPHPCKADDRILTINTCREKYKSGRRDVFKLKRSADTRTWTEWTRLRQATGRATYKMSMRNQGSRKPTTSHRHINWLCLWNCCLLCPVNSWRGFVLQVHWDCCSKQDTEILSSSFIRSSQKCVNFNGGCHNFAMNC